MGLSFWRARQYGIEQDFEDADERYVDAADGPRPQAGQRLRSRPPGGVPRVQPRLARRPSPRALTRWCVARGGGAAPGSSRRRGLVPIHATTPQLACVVETERLTPVADGFVRHCDASLGEQIFHIANTQAESVVELDRVADDLGEKPIAAGAGRRARHRPTLPVATTT